MKKAILTTLVIVFLLGAYGVIHICRIEPFWFEVRRTNIQLPPGKRLQTPLKILLLSDFHAGDSVPYPEIERAVDLGIKEKPDLIFLCGDFVTGKIRNRERYIKILKKLPDTAPTFACLGNHDGGVWAAGYGGYKDCSAIENLLRESGITPLTNRSADIEIRDSKLKVVGLGDLWAEQFEPRKILTENKMRNGIPLILLSHNPDSKDYLAYYDWDIMFCGHTHGGQLSIPLIGTPFAPVRDRDFVEGLHDWKGRKIYITKGVGNLHGKRLNCRPEISIINLMPFGN